MIPFTEPHTIEPPDELQRLLEDLESRVTRTDGGFSLLELSIVLVILGLLAGGVLSGKSLIRAAELRTIGTERDRFRTAMYAFRDKYFMLPGDISNATSFWGWRQPVRG